MGKWVAVLLGGMVLTWPWSAGAADLPAEEKRALSRHMDDLVDCLAYYSIAQAVLEKAGQRATAARVGEITKTLLDRSFIVMEAVDMTQETALARQKEAVRKQMGLIGNDLGKFSRLTGRYGEFCKSVVESPGQRIEFWKRNAPRN